jgi:hypothetical protein
MKKIAFISAALLLGCLIQVMAQNRQINGTVRCSYDSVPLFPVSISLSGTTFGAITNEKGAFSLRIPENHSVNNNLCFSFVGMKCKCIEITGQEHKNIDVFMEPDIIGLAEVTIVYDTLMHRSQSYLTEYKKDIFVKINTLVWVDGLQSDNHKWDLRKKTRIPDRMTNSPSM